jgi:uncharacterized membrane protein YfcA
MSMLLNIPLLLLISIGVGFLCALTGLGGASILIPILVFLGIPVKEAIASSMVAIIATSSGSAISFVRENLANIKIAMYLEIFTVLGAIAGATVTTLINPVFLYFFFAAFLVTSFLRIRQPLDEFIGAKKQDRQSAWLELRGEYYDRYQGKRIVYRATNAVLGGGGMLLAGLAAGMLGIGAGAFKVTVHEGILKMPPKVSSATSDLIIGMTALAGVSVYLFSGLLNLTLMAPMAIGTTIGAYIGGLLLGSTSNRVIRFLFYSIVVFLIAQMLYKGISLI